MSPDPSGTGGAPRGRSEAVASERGLTAGALFVAGSHRFHEVFVDLYFLRRLVRPGGLIVPDDAAWPALLRQLGIGSRMSVEGATLCVWLITARRAGATRPASASGP